MNNLVYFPELIDINKLNIFCTVFWLQTVCNGIGSINGCKTRNITLNGMTAHSNTICMRVTALSRSWNNVIDFSWIHKSKQVVVRIFVNLIYSFYFHSKVTQSFCVSFCCIKLEAHVVEFSCKGRKFITVSFTHAEKNSPASLHVVTSSYKSFENSFFHCGSNSKNFTSWLHFWSQVSINIHKFFKTEDRNFYCKIWRNLIKTSSVSHILYTLPKHGTNSKVYHRNVCYFWNVRNCTAWTRVYFNNVQIVVVNKILNVYKTFCSKCQSKFPGLIDNLFADYVVQVPAWINCNGVSWVNTSSFNVFHDSRNKNIFSVTDCINFKFSSHFVLVNKDWVFNSLSQNDFHVFFYVIIVEGDNHILTAKNITWAEKNRISKFLCSFQSFFFCKNCKSTGALDLKLFTKFVKAFAVFCKIYGISWSSKNSDSLISQKVCKLDCCTATKSNYNTHWFFCIDYTHYIFWSKRFKVKAVWCIKVCRNCFRVIVDCHYFITKAFQSPYTLNWSVVEFDTLTNADWTWT